MARAKRGRSEVEARLAIIRGGAPRRSPTVRVLAAYAGHADCNLANLGFAARVDFDRLLVGTEFEGHFGQSPFAFSRGRAFERMIAEHGYAATLDLLRTSMGFSISDARIVNLRDGYPRNSQGMVLRANHTRALIRGLLKGDPRAPNLIDGAVLEGNIGGLTARFEADALAARFGGPIHVGEVKSFPVIDGRAEPDKLAAALNQVSVYIFLTKLLVEELGGDADLVSPQAMLITPKNVGLRPTLSVQDVTKRIGRFQRLLASVPKVNDIADTVPRGLSFGSIADTNVDPIRRVDTLHELADGIGTTYSPSCLSSCGNALFCRARAFRAGASCIVGPEAERLLPGVQSLRRAAELTDGAPPTRNEVAVAQQLARAGRLYDAAAKRALPRRARNAAL